MTKREELIWEMMAAMKRLGPVDEKQANAIMEKAIKIGKPVVSDKGYADAIKAVRKIG